VESWANSSLCAAKREPDEVRRWDAPGLLRLWHLASLDAPTVAVVWSWGFAWTAGVRLAPWAPLVLALVAWALYIGDRLLDAQAGMRTPPLHRLRERHYFHWRHRRILAPIGLIAGAVGAAIAITRLPSGARVPDSAIAAATLAYFSGVHSRRQLPTWMERLLLRLSSRALLIGAIFTAGCLLPLWSQTGGGNTQGSIGRLLAVPALFFAVLAWLNCQAIGWWESNPPAANVNPVGRVSFWVSLAGGVLAAVLAQTQLRPAVLILAGAASALLLAVLDDLRGRLTPLALRAGADLVLLTPAVVLVFWPLHI
jgi:hypothetical protein